MITRVMKGGIKNNMIYEWKKGDKLRIIEPASGEFNIGDIVIADNDVSTNNPDYSETYITVNGNRKGGYYAGRFEKTGKSAKVKKITEDDEHIVLVDSCNNFVGTRNSYKEAEDLAKGQIQDVTIYKLVAKAKVSTKTERTVKTIYPKRKR